MVVKLFRRLFSILQLELQLDLKVFTMALTSESFHLFQAQLYNVKL
jgi:hypothetical protein